MKKHDLTYLPLSEIKIGERFRKNYGDRDFNELVESIRLKGIIQPISVDSDYNLLAGGRRYAAASAVGLTEVPCVVREVVDEIDSREIELFENIHRLEMSWQERTSLVDRIHSLQREKHGKDWTQTQTAQMLGISNSRVTDALDLTRAMKVMPELSDCSTEHEARKAVKRIQEKLALAQLAKDRGWDTPAEPADPKAQQTYVPSADAPKKLDPAEYAASHYRIGDCIKELRELADYYQSSKNQSAIQLFEVDPPYAIDLNEMKKGNAHYNKTYNEVEQESYPDFIFQTASACYDVAGKNAWMIWWFGPSWFCETKRALDAAGWLIDDIPGIWTKPHGQTNAPEYYLARAWEPFFICRKGSPLLNGRGRLNVFNFDPVPSQKKYHPTQRPLALMQELLRTFAFPGSVICSPFLGSGATLKAAYKEQMMGFGFDLSEEYRNKFLASLAGDS